MVNVAQIPQKRKLPLEKIPRHYKPFNWTDEQLNKDIITLELLGGNWYWENSVYDGMTAIEIESEILREAKPENWGKTSCFDKPYYQHFLMLMRLIFPQTDITPTLADIVCTFCLCRTWDVSILNLIASQNAGKSGTKMRIAFTCLIIDPDNTYVYVANPFENSASSTIWKEARNLWKQMCDEYPNVVDSEGKPTEGTCLLPDATMVGSNFLRVKPGSDMGIQLQNVKKEGKFKGAKVQSDQFGFEVGLILLLIDEVNELDSHSFLEMQANLQSQRNYCAITSQNFKSQDDMGGRLTEPINVRGFESIKACPASEAELLHDFKENAYIWESQYNSITIRHDGLLSPNILAGRTIYPRLFKLADWHRLISKHGGEDSPAAWSQGRSFPIQGTDTQSILPRAKIHASRVEDPYFQFDKPPVHYGFLDPSSGLENRDKCLWGFAAGGEATVQDGEGNSVAQEILEYRQEFKQIYVKVGAKWDNTWFGYLEDLGVPREYFDRGVPIDHDIQIAIRAALLNKQHNVIAENFGFDFSMRLGITHAIYKIIGVDAVGFDYKGKPKGGRYLDSYKADSKEVCYNRCTEVGMVFVDSVVSKQVRGGNHIKPALLQTSRTYFNTSKNVTRFFDKADFIKRWGNSPDDRDVAWGIADLAHKRGFRSGVGFEDDSGGMADFWKQQNELHDSEIQSNYFDDIDLSKL